MPSPLTIRHPTAEYPVKTLGFVASGSAPGKVRGFLIFLGQKWTDQATTIDGTVFLGEAIKTELPNWRLAFRVKKAGYYLLVVRVAQTGQSKTVIFKHEGRAVRGLEIGYPSASEPVDANYPIDSYGTCGNEASVTGRMTCSNAAAHQFNAGPTDTVPGLFIWTLTFNIPTSEPSGHNTFTCRVWETGNMNNDDTESGIQVDNLA